MARSACTLVCLMAVTSMVLTGSVTGLGINCRGSSSCGIAGGFSGQSILQIKGLLDGTFFSGQPPIDPNRFYQNGEQIACAGSICAFLQNSGGAPGSSIPPLVDALLDHGCDICGSVPLFFPQDNDVNNGELTINFVSNTCTGFGSGLCP